MRGEPLVSVHCASYNHERFVEACVQSVLTQTVDDLEMIVVDDGSVDGTWDRLETLASEDSRLHILRHGSGVNRGRHATLSVAAGRASGRYLARIDSDDRWLADKLERQLPALERGALLSYGKMRRIDEYGRSFDGWVFGSRPRDAAPGVGAFEAMLLRNYVPSGTAVFSRRAFEQVGGYPPVTWEDYALWARLVSLAEPAFVDEVIAEYRRHALQEHRRLSVSGNEIRADVEVLDDLARWSGLAAGLVPLTEGYRRCYGALRDLIDGRTTSDLGLEQDDAFRLATILPRRWTRLIDLCGLRRVYDWTGRLMDTGPSFRRGIGPEWKGFLGRRGREAVRERRTAKAAAYLAASAAVGARLRFGRV